MASGARPFSLVLKSARLKAAVWRHRAPLLAGIVAILLANGFALLQPFLLGRGVDAIVRKQPDRLPLIFIAIVAAAAADAVFRFLQRYTVNGVARRIENELRRDMFEQLERLDQRFFQGMRTGDIMARATNDLSAVQQLLGMGLSSIFNTVVIFTAAVVLMLWIDWQLTLLSVSLLTLLSLGFLVLGPQIQKRFLRVQEQFAALSSKAQENFSGIRVVKAYVQEEAEQRSFRAINQEYVDANIAWARINSALWPLFGTLAGLAAVVMLYVGGQHVVQHRLTLGQFVQFNTYLILLSWPMIALGWVSNLFQQGAASLNRIEEILHQTPAVASPPRPLRPEAVRGELTFENVSFRYVDEPIFENLSLHVPAGSTLALVGSTGSGKSTLVRLLARVYDPQEGRILIDGTDIRDLPLDVLRRQIGYVPQEAFLFSETLAENIMLGAPDAPAESVERAAELSQLSADLEQFPNGLQTMIGERGVTLSGGQKQRTAIARAVLKDPAILVLDDALSSVDTRTEEAILRGLRGFMEGRTSIVIAHRISTIKDADQIVVLEEGRVVEQGSHARLLGEGGEYARLYERQQLRRELEEEELPGPALGAER
ncbi:MAG: ABC transporter ATP-binding protein [Chloroflexi bacterium]|nr:MAG: ABC transporter ATP-binding protein [Chloroflexota bacterium]